MAKKDEFTGEVKVDKYESSSKRESKKYDIVFKLNGSRDIKIGRVWYHFEPYEKKTVDESVITHPDFLQQINYFTIKEA